MMIRKRISSTSAAHTNVVATVMVDDMTVRSVR